MKFSGDKDLQYFIGNLLRIGVIFAMTIVVAGLILYLFQYGKDIAHYETFDTKAVFRFSTFYTSLRQGNSKAIMQLGVMVLIATPVARVLFTMIGFWLEKDRMYTIIALIVLCIITFSLLFGVTSH